ncbi:MAG: hypothetical protein EOM67_14655, partial [Spirochaetia bacterium]|nr:hypothetical protein [Spirochaetia bacterium]
MFANSFSKLSLLSIISSFLNAILDIFDTEGDSINPIINHNQLSGWGALAVQLIDNGQRLKISATSTGPDGRYDITLNAQDTLGAISTKTCPIIIGNGLCGN